MDYSLPALFGAVVGTMLGAVIYAAALRSLDRWMRTVEAPPAPQQREAFERRLSVMRRAILALDIVLCAAIGYWVGAAWDGAAAKGPL